MVALNKQLKETEKCVAGAQNRELDGPVHDVQPGDYVYVAEKSFGTTVRGTIPSAPHHLYCNQDEGTKCLDPSLSSEESS